MLHDMIHHQQQLAIVLPQTANVFFEVFSSLPSAQEFEFDESELFPDTHQNNSEVASSSNGGNEEYSSNPTDFSFTSKMNLYTENFDTITSNSTISIVLNMNNNNNNKIESTDNLSLVFDYFGKIEEGIAIASNNNKNNNNNRDTDNLSVVFDSPGEIGNDIVFASIDFNHSTNYTTPQFINNQQEQQFDLISSLNHQVIHGANDIITNNSLNPQYNNIPSPPVFTPMITSSVLPHSFEDESLLARDVQSYTQMNPTTHSCSLIKSGLGTHMSTALPFGDFNFHVDNNIDNNFPYTMIPAFDCKDDLQALIDENQHLIKGHSTTTPSTSERVSNFDESSTVKVGKLYIEERKEKINRYMKKRNKRNFSKKIKYACRKTLADSRPRVRGRFAKHDDLIEGVRGAIEEDTEENVVLRDGDLVVSSDIFAQFGGVNTFNCNNSLNPIPSWI